MIKPNIPPNEVQRLKELDAYQLIGMAEDDDYDFITTMAAQICNSKISLISFVLEDKQWFLSHHGLAAREASREESFCGHAINKPDEIMIIDDARKDIRFWDNPFTTGDPYVIFYAGVPLVSPNGMPLGTLCVIDDRPKNLTPLQIQQLKSLAKQTLNLFQLRRNQLELHKTNNDLIKNIIKEQEVEQQLRIAMKNLQAIFDASQQVSIIATDTTGIITQFNAGAERMLGYTAEELLGLHTPQLIHLDKEMEEEAANLSE
ncbi:MAG TPA: PAS domain S-box protein, partial [Bacteroidia bacterium]|nr:PAS domain S-box protein [Bacteroidia bacterium]